MAVQMMTILSGLVLIYTVNGVRGVLARHELEGEGDLLPALSDHELNEDEQWTTSVGTQGECLFTITPADLESINILSDDYKQCTSTMMVWTVMASPKALLRLHLDAGTSRLKSGETLSLLDDNLLMAQLTAIQQRIWLATVSNIISVIYSTSADVATRGHINVTLTSYPMNSSTVYMTSPRGVLEGAEEQTGLEDYAPNTEILWQLQVQDAYHYNITIDSISLDASTDDVIVCGPGEGNVTDSLAGILLTGNFHSARRFHVVGDKAFVYFLSRNHARPRPVFNISYVTEVMVGTTTPLPTTTDKNHPPTPSDRDFQVEIYISGTDPKLFMNTSGSAVEKLKSTLALYTYGYCEDHHIDVWRVVHANDMQFSHWLLCNYVSGWVKPDPNCFQVTWYVDMLTTSGDWALYTDDLRGVIMEEGDYINQDLGYKVSLEVPQFEKLWWKVLTIALLPLSLLIFIVLFINRNRSQRLRSQTDEDLSIDDDESCVADDVITGKEITKVIKEVQSKQPEHTDRQLDAVFDAGGYQDYDPELRGRQKKRALQARYSRPPDTPLKSALKSPKPPAAEPAGAYSNPAFEPDELSPLTSPERQRAARGQVFFPPDPPARAGPQEQPAASPPAPLHTQQQQPARSAPEPPQPATPAPWLQEPLLAPRAVLQQPAELEKVPEPEEPGLELPRITGLRAPSQDTLDSSKLYRVHDDGTGTEVEAADPRARNIVQLLDIDAESETYM